MIRHYLTFAHEAALLDRELRGWWLAECWSQEKNMLILRFIRGRESRFVEIAVDPQLGHALPREDIHRARRNTIDFFASLLGAKLEDVAIHDGERVIILRFTDGQQLALFFFGGGGGNVLMLRDGEVAESFMKYAGEYESILSGEDDGELRDPDAIRDALRGSAEPLARALMRAIPELGRRLAVEAILRAGLADSATAGDLSDEAIERLFASVDQLYGAAEQSTRYFLYMLPDEVVFSLIELRSLGENAERVEEFDDLARAIRVYRSSSGRRKDLSALRDRIVKRLTTEQGRLERSLANRLDAGSQLKRAAAWESDGSLLMSNLPSIVKGSDRAHLTDWEGNEREIALDARLSPLENAERYFRKARGARDAAGRGTKGIEKTRKTLERIAGLLVRAAGAERSDELERIEQENKDLFTMVAETKEQGSAERFRRFEIPGGHEVYAGKNASNNDELTMRFARPNDYWFHARGSSGSHVVLRWNDAKTKPPKDAIRQAASIAAYYSGARGAKMVPVAYTLKKHVRKPRGAAVGAVMMEREEVVMVEPKLPAGSEE